MGNNNSKKNDVKMAKDITDAGVLSGNAYDAPPPNNKKIKAHAEGPHTTVPGSKQHPLVANLLTGDYASDAVKHGVEHTLSAVVRDFGDDEEIRTAAVEMYNDPGASALARELLEDAANLELQDDEFTKMASTLFASIQTKKKLTKADIDGLSDGTTKYVATIKTLIHRAKAEKKAAEQRNKLKWIFLIVVVIVLLIVACWFSKQQISPDAAPAGAGSKMVSVNTMVSATAPALAALMVSKAGSNKVLG